MARPLIGGGGGVKAGPLRKKNYFEALKKSQNKILQKMWSLRGFPYLRVTIAMFPLNVLYFVVEQVKIMCMSK